MSDARVLCPCHSVCRVPAHGSPRTYYAQHAAYWTEERTRQSDPVLERLRNRRHLDEAARRIADSARAAEIEAERERLEQEEERAAYLQRAEAARNAHHAARVESAAVRSSPVSAGHTHGAATASTGSPAPQRTDEQWLSEGPRRQAAQAALASEEVHKQGGQTPQSSVSQPHRQSPHVARLSELHGDGVGARQPSPPSTTLNQLAERARRESPAAAARETSKISTPIAGEHESVRVDRGEAAATRSVHRSRPEVGRESLAGASRGHTSGHDLDAWSTDRARPPTRELFSAPGYSVEERRMDDEDARHSPLAPMVIHRPNEWSPSMLGRALRPGDDQRDAREAELLAMLDRRQLEDERRAWQAARGGAPAAVHRREGGTRPRSSPGRGGRSSGSSPVSRSPGRSPAPSPSHRVRNSPSPARPTESSRRRQRSVSRDRDEPERDAPRRASSGRPPSAPRQRPSTTTQASHTPKAEHIPVVRAPAQTVTPSAAPSSTERSTRTAAPRGLPQPPIVTPPEFRPLPPTIGSPSKDELRALGVNGQQPTTAAEGTRSPLELSASGSLVWRDANLQNSTGGKSAATRTPTREGAAGPPSPGSSPIAKDDGSPVRSQLTTITAPSDYDTRSATTDSHRRRGGGGGGVSADTDGEGTTATEANTSITSAERDPPGARFGPEDTFTTRLQAYTEKVSAYKQRLAEQAAISVAASGGSPSQPTPSNGEGSGLSMGATLEPSAHHDGLRVKEVDGGKPADQAGLRPGDVILQVGGILTLDHAEMRAALAACVPGAEVPVLVQRGRARYTVPVLL